jgi:methyl-accepting chemotaxis protein
MVAGDVKNLANQTAKATEEISAQISAVQTANRESDGAIQGIGATIGKISDIATVFCAGSPERSDHNLPNMAEHCEYSS